MNMIHVGVGEGTVTGQKLGAQLRTLPRSLRTCHQHHGAAEGAEMWSTLSQTIWLCDCKDSAQTETALYLAGEQQTYSVAP